MKTTKSKWYKPQEPVPRYPLELSERGHIELWDEKGEYKWSIALWDITGEGPELRFVGDRPLDKRVNWKHFEELIRHGDLMMWAKHNKESE